MINPNSPKKNREVERLKRLLHTRLRRRAHETGHLWEVDLRQEGLNGKRFAVRNPDHPEWPKLGTVARTQEEALEWIDTYVERLGPAWVRGKDSVLRTVREHGEDYLASLTAAKGADHNTVIGYGGCLANHIYPALGDRPLKTLDTGSVRAFIGGLTKPNGEPYSAAVKSTTLTVLGHLWRRANPDYVAPWRGQVQVTGDRSREVRDLAKSSDRGVRQAAYSVDELRWILVTAMACDLDFRNNPRARRGRANHADILAFIIHNMVRIEEVTFIRVRDVDLDARAIESPVTKNANKRMLERRLVIQAAYEPWIRRLISDRPDPDHFLIPTSHPARPPRVDTYKCKVGKVLRAAGLKRPGQLTHVFRGVHSSIAAAAGIPPSIIRALSGRKIQGDPELSNHYFYWGAFLENLDEKTFSYFPDLGTPEDLEAEAEEALRKGRIVLRGGGAE